MAATVKRVNRIITVITFRIPSKVDLAVIEMGTVITMLLPQLSGKLCIRHVSPPILAIKLTSCRSLSPCFAASKDLLLVHLPFPQDMEQIITAKIIVGG